MRFTRTEPGLTCRCATGHRGEEEADCEGCSSSVDGADAGDMGTPFSASLCSSSRIRSSRLSTPARVTGLCLYVRMRMPRVRCCQTSGYPYLLRWSLSRITQVFPKVRHRSHVVSPCPTIHLVRRALHAEHAIDACSRARDGREGENDMESFHEVLPCD